MAKSFVFSALLVASLLVATPVNVNGDISDIVKAAGMIVEFLSGGDCPNFSGSDQCKCRSFMLIINSGDRANSTAHKGPTLVYDRSSYKWGSQCQIGNQVITNGQSGGVQVGNADNTYKTGVETDIYYQVFSQDKTKAYDCRVKFYLDNPYWTSNEYSANLEGNGCPANIKIEQGQYVGGNYAVIQYFVYYEKNPVLAESASAERAAVTTSNTLSSICSGSSWYDLPTAVINNNSILRTHAKLIGTSMVTDPACEVSAYPKIASACVRSVSSDPSQGLVYQYKATTTHRCPGKKTITKTFMSQVNAFQ